MAGSGVRKAQTNRGLIADAPDHELKEKLMLFGQLIGDRKIDAWQCVWIAPSSGTVRTILVRQVGDEIVLEGTTSKGHPERWIYSKITP